MIFKDLFRRKVRTLLTAVGVGIGVAAVVALGAIAEGMVSQITGMLTKGGADLTVIQSKVADIALSAVDEEIGDKILERFGGFATSVVLPLPAPEHETLLLPSLRRVQAAKPIRLTA